MKSSVRRRSAFSVYQSQIGKDEESSQKEEEKANQPSGSKKRPCDENPSKSTSKKVSKLLVSSKSLDDDGTNGIFDHEEQTPDILEPKQKGKGKLFSKANKLRQSLSLSSRKKKRNGYRSYDRVDLQEKSSGNLTVHSLPADKSDRTDSETGNEETCQEGQAKWNSEQEDIEADRLFSWLISPVKPGKFFRYRFNLLLSPGTDQFVFGTVFREVNFFFYPDT